ncbi:hypothetical protein ACI77M_03880 [Pseudomonas fildesensis]|uniref:hypothetical protein n=1 Tax=Pseudomonas fildesensis TaxID=1674920 RepID=UPI00387B7838
MSEVERYWIEPSRLIQEGRHQDDTCVVKDWAYDRAVAERDALQALLTAADEELDRAGGAYLNKNAECLELRKRAVVLEGLLLSLPEDLKDLSGSENTAGVYACIDYIEQCVAALKPTEGGGDE